MSIAVTLQQLADTMAGYRFAYLLSVGDDGRPHAVAVRPTLSDDTLLVQEMGRRTRANVAARPPVTLLWPPEDPADYSLIVDGVAAPRGEELAVAPTRAVLHRPAQPREPATGSECTSDCVEVLPR